MPSPAPTDLTAAALLGGTLLLAALAGLWRATARPAGFDTADRNVPPFLGGAAVCAAFLTAAPFAGLTATLYALGSDGLAWLGGLAAGLVLMGVLIAPALRAAGAATVPDFLAQRFASRAVKVTAALIVVACLLPLLAAQFSAAGTVAQAAAGIHPSHAIAAAVACVMLVLVPGGLRGAIAAGAVLLAIVLLAAVLPLGKLATATTAVPFGHLGYGQSLSEVPRLEIEMIVGALADARTLKPHLRPFLQIDVANTLALLVSLMAGTAALPHVLIASTATAGVRQTRYAVAWALLLAAAVLSAVPAYAVLSKHQVYGLIAKGTPLQSLGEEFRAFSRDGRVSIHGVSLMLLDDVADAVASGAADAGSIADRLGASNARSRAAWVELKPQVQGALLDAARKGRDASEEQRWDDLRASVLPVAAQAAGNKTGKLTQGALTIAPEATIPFALSLAGVGDIWRALLAAGVLAAALAAAAAVTFTIGQALTRDLGNGRNENQRLIRPRLAIAATAAAGGLMASWLPVDLAAFASWPFALAAAGLFPVLVLGIWWRRTTAAGAIAGMLAGTLVTVAYIAGTTLEPVRLHQVTAALSSAGPTEAKRISDLQMQAQNAAGPAKAAAEAALQSYAGGNDVAVGAANWFGLHGRAAGVFGLAVGFLTIVLVSLLTRRSAPAGAAP